MAASAEINVLALVKGMERYVFLYDDSSRAETLRVLGRFASNPKLSFTWYDAAVLSQKIREDVKETPRMRSPFRRSEPVTPTDATHTELTLTPEYQAGREAYLAGLDDGVCPHIVERSADGTPLGDNYEQISKSRDRWMRGYWETHTKEFMAQLDATRALVTETI